MVQRGWLPTSGLEWAWPAPRWLEILPHALLPPPQPLNVSPPTFLSGRQGPFFRCPLTRTCHGGRLPSRSMIATSGLASFEMPAMRTRTPSYGDPSRLPCLAFAPAGTSAGACPTWLPARITWLCEWRGADNRFSRRTSGVDVRRPTLRRVTCDVRRGNARKAESEFGPVEMQQASPKDPELELRDLREELKQLRVWPGSTEQCGVFAEELESDRDHQRRLCPMYLVACC